ncbi:MAG: peptide deformylase [Parcubacteria group bacterium Gr01-1014_29]|nr:MAG: peptide deformylase [Parcubacteria group bacterium Gr01-1014_29]
MKDKIIKEPNKVLHQHAAEVLIEEITSPKIQRVIQDMKDALQKTREGIGIAAPQIGYALRIFLASEEALRWDKVKDLPEEERSTMKWEYYTFINPVIKKTASKKINETEGCLSVPGIYGAVERKEKATIEAYNEWGEKFQRGTSKLYARVMQHEIDHLNGILFIEKAKNIQKLSRKKEES